MKKIALGLFVFTTILACRGHKGDEGPEGPPGEDGDYIVGQTFEFEDVDFDYEEDDNIYSTIIDIPDDIDMFESDAILAYLIEEDGDLETYSLLPQAFFVGDEDDDGEEKGTLTYVFNHTAPSDDSNGDIELLIDGDFDMSDLDPGFTENQVFRFVVVPSDFVDEAQDLNIDLETYSGLLDSGIELESVD